MYLSLYSVPCEGKSLCALVPDYFVDRLLEDDPIWRGKNVAKHWSHWVDEKKARVKPSNKIKFFMADAEVNQTRLAEVRREKKAWDVWQDNLIPSGWNRANY